MEHTQPNEAISNGNTQAGNSQVVLTPLQVALRDALTARDANLADMYFGALCALTQKSNPERFSQCAQSLRELVEKLAFVEKEPNLKTKIQKAERFSKEATAFQEIDPTYIRGLISGLSEAVKSPKPIDWEPTLVLCAWVVSQPVEIPGRADENWDWNKGDPNWRGARKAIASLISIGSYKGAGEIPFPLREQVFYVLQILVQDSDPTSDYEQKSGWKDEPANLAINTVRGLSDVKGEVEENLSAKLQKFWNLRWDEARLSNSHEKYDKELLAFAWWFESEALDPKWALEQLQDVLKFCRLPDHEFLITKTLAKLVGQFPHLCMKCLYLLEKNMGRERSFMLDRRDVETVLKAAFASGDQATVEFATITRDALLARGNFEYRALK